MGHHTYKVIHRGRTTLLAAAIDMETGMRGYLLAGKEQFLDPYKAGSETFFARTEPAEDGLDNPAQVQLLQEAEANIREWQPTVVEPTIALRREIGDAKTMDDMADWSARRAARPTFDKFRGIMTAFEGRGRPDGSAQGRGRQRYPTPTA